MNKAKGPINQITLGLAAASLLALTGCVGVVGGGYGDEVVLPGPDEGVVNAVAEK